jgi:hypothetical protein
MSYLIFVFRIGEPAGGFAISEAGAQSFGDIRWRGLRHALRAAPRHPVPWRGARAGDAHNRAGRRATWHAGGRAARFRRPFPKPDAIRRVGCRWMFVSTGARQRLHFSTNRPLAAVPPADPPAPYPPEPLDRVPSTVAMWADGVERDARQGSHARSADRPSVPQPRGCP